MKTLLKTLFISLFIMMSHQSKAQIFQNLLNSATEVVTAITGGSSVTSANLVGTWSYTNPAVELDGDNVLTNVAGTVVTSQVETKLSTVCSSVGISAGVCSITFSSDNSFSFAVKGKSLSGTYTTDGDAGTVALKFSVAGAVNLGTVTANVTLSGSSLSLLFNADTLLAFVSKLSSSSSNTSLQLISTIANEYDGILMGFEFSK